MQPASGLWPGDVFAPILFVYTFRRALSLALTAFQRRHEQYRALVGTCALSGALFLAAHTGSVDNRAAQIVAKPGEQRIAELKRIAEDENREEIHGVTLSEGAEKTLDSEVTRVTTKRDATINKTKYKKEEAEDAQATQ